MNRRAISMLEIIIAVAILVVAVVPLFTLMSKQTTDTDLVASQAYAINKASETLNAFLDNVPFAAIRQGNPGYLAVDDISKMAKFTRYDDNWAKKMSTMLFNNTKKDSVGYPCKGIIEDARGTAYLIHLKVEDVCSVEKLSKPERIQIGTSYPDGSPTEFSDKNEISFAFLRNPSALSDGSWMEIYAKKLNEPGKPVSELDLPTQISEAPENLYNDMGITLPAGAPSFLNPTAERYFPKMVTQKTAYKTTEQFSWCSMKKLIIQVQWNNKSQYLKEPENEAGDIQRLHLMTVKGDLD